VGNIIEAKSAVPSTLKRRRMSGIPHFVTPPSRALPFSSPVIRASSGRWPTNFDHCLRDFAGGKLDWFSEGYCTMTKVAVYHDSADLELMSYRAVSGRKQAMGRTAGEALDALASQLPQEETGPLVIVRKMGPDQFFSAEQRSRLEELTELRRKAIAANSRLAAHDEAELEQLVDAELRAATRRATALFHDLTG
jgi:hypothetical protein